MAAGESAGVSVVGGSSGAVDGIRGIGCLPCTVSGPIASQGWMEERTFFEGL